MVNPSAAILMYHRIADRSPATAPWFERGTAVTPQAFAAQMAWLAQRFDVVPLAAIREAGRHTRPRVAITFDDGYADVMQHALPVLAELGVPATVFVVARPDAAALWFDRWYALWAARPRTTNLNDFLLAARCELPSEPDVTWWVRGPLKQALSHMSCGERSKWLDLLEQDVPELGYIAYLSADDRKTLVGSGWTVGGHGATHTHLTRLDDAELARELQASALKVERSGTPSPFAFAYPDGAWDGRVAAAVAAAGFQLACTVESGEVTNATPPLALFRLLCRGNAEVAHPLLAQIAESGVAVRAVA